MSASTGDADKVCNCGHPDDPRSHHDPRGCYSLPRLPDPTGDTDPDPVSDDRLADVLAEAGASWPGPQVSYWTHQAAAIRAAAAEDPRVWRAVAPPEVVAVYAAAVAWGTGGDEWAHIEALGEAVAAVPEYLRGDA